MRFSRVPPSGGSLEIGNLKFLLNFGGWRVDVPPSGGSLEIGNVKYLGVFVGGGGFPLRGDP